jgi:hypothetical protein
MGRLGKIAVLALVGLLVVPTLVQAEPFVVSDPYPAWDEQPAEFRIVLSFTVPAHKLPDGSVMLMFDAAQLPDGEYRLAVSAVSGADRMESPATSAKLVKTGSKIKVEQAKEKIAPTRIDGLPPKAPKRRSGDRPSR